MLHEPAMEMETDYASKKKTNLGIILFLVYAFIYGVFVFVGIVHTDFLGIKVFAGLNLAVVYGIGLIILAMIMGFVYNLACTRMENKMKEGGRP